MDPDPCLGMLPGVNFACCGHGTDNGYIAFENGVTIRMRTCEVEEREFSRSETGEQYRVVDRINGGYQSGWLYSLDYATNQWKVEWVED